MLCFAYALCMLYGKKSKILGQAGEGVLDSPIHISLKVALPLSQSYTKSQREPPVFNILLIILPVQPIKKEGTAFIPYPLLLPGSLQSYSQFLLYLRH